MTYREVVYDASLEIFKAGIRWAADRISAGAITHRQDPSEIAAALRDDAVFLPEIPDADVSK